MFNLPIMTFLKDRNSLTYTEGSFSHFNTNLKQDAGH